MVNKNIILASQSKFRANILAQSGVDVALVKANIDERAIEKAQPGLSARALAQKLAIAKAQDVAKRHDGYFIIGADQTLEFEGQIYHKVADRAAAHARLLAMQGKTHQLHSAICLAKGDNILYQQVFTVNMTMRPLTSAFIDAYLLRAGDDILSSVGCYQIEALGIQLFDQYDGDIFTIMGLPLLALLAQLRQWQAIDG